MIDLLGARVSAPLARDRAEPRGRADVAPRRTPPTRAVEDRLNRRGSLEPREPGRPRRSLVLTLVLACVTLMTLDHVNDGAAVDPLRRLVGEVYGPAEAGVNNLVDPVVAVPHWLRSRHDLATDLDRLQTENDQLRADIASTDYNRNRLQEYDDLTATVLLVVDADSTVGGRVGRSMKVGFLHGRGDLGQGARLDLELVDQTYVPAEGETVVTWGSQDGAPYVSGVPVGRVESVYSSPRETTQRAVIEPYVDFSALDLVGVVVPSGTPSDRGVIEVDGLR